MEVAIRVGEALSPIVTTPFVVALGAQPLFLLLRSFARAEAGFRPWGLLTGGRIRLGPHAPDRRLVTRNRHVFSLPPGDKNGGLTALCGGKEAGERIESAQASMVMP